MSILEAKKMEAKIAERGQITIPKPIREKLGLKKGTLLDFRTENGKIIAEKVVLHDPIKKVMGILKNEISDTDEFMKEIQIEFSPCTVESCLIAGQIWNNYRAKKNKNTLRRIAADFLIGAHALNQCDLLLTRDSQFYRKYFKKLKILNPAD